MLSSIPVATIVLISELPPVGEHSVFRTSPLPMS
jgi:hypothetical protein